MSPQAGIRLLGGDSSAPLFGFGAVHQHAYVPSRTQLCPSRKRPCCLRAAKQHEEIAPVAVEHGATPQPINELSSFPSKEEQIHIAERKILLWVLGHETGRIMSGHKPAHFMSDQINDTVSNESLDQQKELEADRWFVQHLGKDPTRQIEVENTLLSLLYAHVRRKVGTEHLFPATGVPITDQLITYAKPELIRNLLFGLFECYRCLLIAQTRRS